jgi:hypothetical protein
MGVRIDEARRHHQIGGIDRLGRAIADPADFGDLAPADRHVGAAARRSGAVNHSAILDQDVVGHRTPPCTVPRHRTTILRAFFRVVMSGVPATNAYAASTSAMIFRPRWRSIIANSYCDCRFIQN